MEAPTPHLLLLPFLLFAVSLISASVADDGAAMLALAKSFRPPPSDWSTTSSTDYCRWTGVRCTTSGRVTSISLVDKSLTGLLAPDISALSELKSIALQRNKLSGKIPSFAKLSSLQEIYMDENLFTGVEPGAFHGLTSLQILSLRHNANLTSWRFPSELADSASNLTAIYLENTQISGVLPDIFDSFASLQILRLSYNNITGPLPPSLAKSPIQNLWINNQRSGSGFSGTIEVLSGMTSLSQAWLHKNQFVGPIPDLSKCESLYDLQLMDNQLTGIVSPSLFSLGSLKNISLDNNRFQGPLPSFPREVERVSARHNYFCTTKAGQSCSLQVMTLLAVAGGFRYPSMLAESWQGDNACSGWAYVNCDSGGKNVVTLNLGKHGFAGFLSPAIANLTYLRGVFLNDNNLTGAIPKELSFMTSLELIDVSNNNLTGEIPIFPPSVKFTHAPGNLLLGTEAGDSLTTGTGSKSPDHSTRAKAVAYLSKKKAGIGLASGLLGIILVAGCLFCLVKWRRKTSYDPQRPNLNALIPLKRYSYVQIKRITNSFAEVVGKGGFGTVYRGTLWDGRGVAVKVLKDLKGNGEDFINEVASMSKTSHVNIVSLLGFCSEGSKKAIIYEFLENGSLDQFISTNTSMNMDWMAIYGIALGVARGVEYLHHGCKTRIVHFDIKPQNVLLDGSLCPKVSDFGLARLCEKNESILSLLDTRGTIGYIAPELFSRMYGRVSHKSDVYSYGMLVLEMIGARSNEKSAQNSASNASSMYFPEWIYKDLEKGDSGKFNGNGITCEEEEITKKMTLVGLWCIQPSPSDRPPMNRVVEMMEGSVDALGVPPRPVFQIPAGHLQEPSSLSEDISV